MPFLQTANIVCGFTVHSGRNTFLFNFAAGRDEWVLPDKKIIPGLYIVVRLGTIFGFGSGQSPGPPEIIRIYTFLIYLKFEPSQDAEVVPG